MRTRVTLSSHLVAVLVLALCGHASLATAQTSMVPYFGKTVDPGFIDQVVDRWRSATLSTRTRPEQSPDGHPGPLSSNPVAQQVTAVQQRLDPDRYRLLKKPAKI